MRKTSYEDVCNATLSALSVAGSEPFYQSKGTYEFYRVDNYKQPYTENVFTFVRYASYRYFSDLGKTYAIFAICEKTDYGTVVDIAGTTQGFSVKLKVYENRTSQKTEIETCFSEIDFSERANLALLLIAHAIDARI